MKLRDLHPAALFKRLLLDNWRKIDEEAFEYRKNNPGAIGADAVMVAVIFSVVAVSLVIQGTFGEGDVYALLLHKVIDSPTGETDHPILFALVGWLKPETGSLYAELYIKGYDRLVELCYWASWRFIGFLVLPLLVIAVYPRLRRTPMGWTFKGFFKHAGIYWLLFTPVFIAVFIVSFFPSYNSYYPFYKLAHRSLFDFAVWESFYVVQFLCLEFFFRGFMLQPLKRTMGSSAIFAMMVPYVLIHVGKPFSECMAAVIAGIILGTLALRTRSIWGGFFIHVGVALSMDLLAIWQVNW